MDVLQFNKPLPCFWTKPVVLRLLFILHKSHSRGCNGKIGARCYPSWLVRVRFCHRWRGRRLRFLGSWLGKTRPAHLKLCHVIHMQVLGAGMTWAVAWMRTQSRAALWARGTGLVTAGVLEVVKETVSWWWDSAGVTQPPRPLPSAFAPKAHCVVIWGSDLKDLWVSATLEDGVLWARRKPRVVILLYLSKSFEVLILPQPPGDLSCASLITLQGWPCVFSYGAPTPPPGL